MENKYLFSLTNQSNQLLHDSNFTGRDVSIVKEEDDDRPPYFSFTSIHLNSLSDPTEIWARGLSLISLYNGASNLDYNPNVNWSFQSDYQFRELYIWDGNHNITPSNFSEILPSYPFDCKLPEINNVEYKNPNNKLDKVIRAAIKEADVLNLLLQLGNGLNWINLYAILDTLEHYSKTKIKDGFSALLNETSISRVNIKAFTGTANNFGMIGVSARHGDRQWGEPANTLTLKQSQTLIINLCNAYFKLAYSIT